MSFLIPDFGLANIFNRLHRLEIWAQSASTCGRQLSLLSSIMPRNLALSSTGINLSYMYRVGSGSLWVI